MTRTGSLKRTLTGTTALIGVALLAVHPAAMAANITVSTPTITTQVLGAGDSLTVTNTGSVTASPAVRVMAAAANFVNNSGTLTGGNYGINVVNNGDISGGITNQAGGTISGATIGVFVINNNSDISGGITNSGTISGGRYGVESSSGSDISHGVVNQAGGVISGDTVAGVYSHSGGDISGGVANSGTISGGQFGIRVRINSDISGGITNQAGGTITGKTGILVSASKISGGITNAGIIDGTSGTAISLVGLTTGSTPITITGGQIIGNVTDSNPAAGFSPVTVDGNFTSQGNFNVSSFSVSSGAAFTFGVGDTITSNSAVSDSGTIVISAAGSSITGGLDVNTGGTLTADGNFSVNGALTNAGTINVDNGRVLTASTFTGSAGSALDVQVGRSAGTLTGGELVATGSAVDLTNTTLDIAIVAGSQPLVAGSTVVIANGNAAGVAPVVAVKDNSFIYDFSVIPTAGNNLTLAVNQAMSFAAATTTTNNANVAQVLLVGLANSTNPQINAIQNNLVSSSSSAQFNRVLEATTPTVDDSGRTAALDVSDNVLGLTEGRLTALRGSDGDDDTGRKKTAGVEAGTQTGMAAGDLPAGADAWGEAFGQHADQGERGNIAGYSASTWGGAAGMDTRNIADDVLAGVAVSYGRTDARSNNANTTDTGVDSYQLTLYGDYMPKGDSYIDGMAAWGWNRDETARHNVGGVSGLSAHGSYDANQATAQVEAGHEYTAGDTILTPDIMAHGVWYNPQSYSESGAGGADLNVSGNNQTLIELGTGIKAGWIFGESDGSIIKPQVRAGYRYALVDDRIEDTAGFTGGGGTFTTQGPSPARGSVNLGATVRYYTPTNWNFTASYDFDWKSDYTSNAGVIKAGYRF